MLCTIESLYSAMAFIAVAGKETSKAAEWVAKDYCATLWNSAGY